MAGTWDTLLEPGMSVFHLAAARNGPSVPAREMERVNVDATLALAKRAAEVGVARFVHTATALIYGPSAGRPRTEEDGMETAVGPYARSKAAAVRALHGLARAGLPAVVVCPALVYGPDTPDHPNRLTSEMRRLLRTRLEVRIGGGRQARNLVHVDDVVRGLLLAEERGRPGEDLILGGEDVSPRDFSRLVLDQAGLTSRAVLPVPAGVAQAAARIADKLRRVEAGCGYSSAAQTLCLAWRFSSQRARRQLGYEPLPLAQGIGKTLHWIRSTERNKT